MHCITDEPTENNQIAKNSYWKKNKPYNKVRLLNYWAWYLWKYAPTLQKLKQKLWLKSNNCTEIQEVVSELSAYIDEQTMAENLMKQTIDSGKSVSVWMKKLKEKQYNSQVIESIKNQYKWILPDDIQLKKRIENYMTKGKGLTYIKMKLWNNTQEKELIQTLYNQISLENSSSQEDLIRPTLEKLRSLWKDDQKIIRKLIADWFSYKNVKKAMSYSEP